MIKAAGIESDKKLTNTSARKHLLTKLADSNIPDRLIVQIIKDVSKNMTKKILVNQQERINAIQKFKNGKSADEYGNTAEHIKFAGKEISFCRFLDICA
jgi:hypothetical protein